MAIKMSFIGTLDSITFWIFSKAQISSQREVSILVCHTDLLNLRFDELSLLDFVGICLFIISEWVPLSYGIL